MAEIGCLVFGDPAALPGILQCCRVSVSVAKLRPGKTLALAEPEARHYNHPGTAQISDLCSTDIQPLLPAANVCIGYISAVSQRNELKFCMIVI